MSLIIDKNKSYIDKIVEELNNDNLIIIPTETVFGIAGKLNKSCYNKIMEVKKRPANKALPVCVSSIDMINSLCNLSKFQSKIINKLLPGPITFILPLKEKLNELDTVAIRYSDDKFLTSIIEKLNHPIYLTSANLSGEDPFENALDASKTFKDQIAIYIEGKIDIGQASTIASLINDEIKILREGPISLEEILKSTKE